MFRRSSLRLFTDRAAARSQQWLAVVGMSLASGCLLYNSVKELHNRDRQQYISRKIVAEHKTAESGIWVTHGTNVYDITRFVEGHPGGNRIMLAAGGPVEPYWKVYSIHQKQSVKEILDQYKIGELDPHEPIEQKVIDVADPFSGDPERSPLLMMLSPTPCNAETPMSLLVDSFITPSEIFYKRNHAPVPHVDDADAFELQFGDARMTVGELKQKYKSHTVVAAIQCAGNRRATITEAGPVAGLLWRGGAIGNAEWTGVLLRDVIRDAYPALDEDELMLKFHHVVFDSVDGYGASIPIEKALDKRGDVLLAYEMNGEPLLPDHGYPLRVLVPGTVAARSVKWVNKVQLSEHESMSHWQQKDYRGFSPSADWDNLKWADSKSIQEMPVQSAICDPGPGTTVARDDDTVTVKGYAWSGGGKSINRVDVSGDGGESWVVAELQQTEQPYNRAWAWTLWTAEVPIASSDKMQLVCKAVDSSYNVQPDYPQGLYNKRGLLSNSWSRVNVAIN